MICPDPVIIWIGSSKQHIEAVSENPQEEIAL